MQKKWLIILICIIIVSGLSFYLFKDYKTEIVADNYNCTSVLSLGEFYVDNYHKSDGKINHPLTHFIFTNLEEENRFISTITNHEGYISDFPGDSTSSYYLFVGNDYYVITKTENDYNIRPLYASIDFDERTVFFPFFVYDLFILTENSFLPYKNNIETNLSLTEFISFYSRIGNNQVIIEESENTVYTNACILYSDFLLTNHPVKIQYVDGNIIVSFIEGE